jgi:TRAP-type C4-dicarboxylate transport system permease small subunit
MKNALVWLGGLGLLAATGVDTLAVVGRHAGLPVEGTIELVQVAVLVAGSLALLSATAARAHAQVHLLVDRLPALLKQGAGRLAALSLALFLAALLAGSVWIAADLWASHEESELLGVPWRWLRLVANAALLAGVLVALRQAVKGRG